MSPGSSGENFSWMGSWGVAISWYFSAMWLLNDSWYSMIFVETPLKLSWILWLWRKAFNLYWWKGWPLKVFFWTLISFNYGQTVPRPDLHIRQDVPYMEAKTGFAMSVPRSAEIWFARNFGGWEDSDDATSVEVERQGGCALFGLDIMETDFSKSPYPSKDSDLFIGVTAFIAAAKVQGIL